MNSQIESKETGELITLEELIAMDGFRDIDPSKIFGDDYVPIFEKRAPYVQTYNSIANAIRGTIPDHWARFGMLRGDRKPQFENFEAMTEDLSLEMRIRVVVILQQYLKDMKRRYPELAKKEYGSMALTYAQDWVRDMLNSIDPETAEACLKANIPEFYYKKAEIKSTDHNEVRTDFKKRIVELLKTLFKKL